MSEDVEWKPGRRRPNRNRKIRQIPKIMELQDVSHPKFFGRQTWYVEKIERCVVNAIVIEESPIRGKTYHGLRVLLPEDAPGISRTVPGIAAALGLAEMVFKASKIISPSMDDIVDRISACTHKRPPFRKSSKWAPLIVSESLEKLSGHPSWKIVTTWDDALKKYLRLTEYLDDIREDEALKTIRTRLRHLCLPVTQENYNIHKGVVLGLKNFKPKKVFTGRAIVNVMEFTPSQ